MKKLILSVLLLLAIGLLVTQTSLFNTSDTANGAPPYDPGGDFVTENEEQELLNDWKRPDGPTKVALQVGHWKTDEVPDELYRLRGNTGASGGGKSEWEVNYAIAEATKELLETQNIAVELLPATVPPQYYADAFVSIHADGSEDPAKSGYKLATSRRDASGKAGKLLSYIEDTYGYATNLEIDPNVTRNMRGYYAFSWRRYEHATHPMTPAVILETGFLSSASDRRLIVNNPDRAAEGLANGILEFLKSENLLHN